jgi:hypothetical protein
MIRFCACGESCLRRHRPGRGTALRSAGGAHAHRRWLRRFTELAKEFGDVDKLAMLMTPPQAGHAGHIVEQSPHCCHVSMALLEQRFKDGERLSFLVHWVSDRRYNLKQSASGSRVPAVLRFC